MAFWLMQPSSFSLLRCCLTSFEPIVIGGEEIEAFPLVKVHGFLSVAFSMNNWSWDIRWPPPKYGSSSIAIFLFALKAGVRF